MRRRSALVGIPPILPKVATVTPQFTGPFWSSPAARWLGLGQGAFYFLTGVWPLLHMRSFIYVTGSKVDLWLVETVGALIAVTGVALFLAAWRRRLATEWAVLAGGQATALAIIDVTYVTRGRIDPIYLADAVVEVGLLAAWIVLWWRHRREEATPADHPRP
jgi:hypothetical protein